MASKPFFDRTRAGWYMKHKPDPKGGWVKVRLGPHDVPFSPSRPPKKPPASILDLAEQFRIAEIRTRQGWDAAKSKSPELAGYLELYATAFSATHKAGSCDILRRCSENFLAFAIDRKIKLVSEVTRSLCRDYLELRAASVCGNTLQTERGYLSPIWSRAVEDGICPINPWKGTKLPAKRIEHVPTFWTSEEVGKIIAACTTQWHANLFRVLANTGIRVSAALAMEWDWINWFRAFISVPPEHDKAGNGYQVAMSRGASEALAPMYACSKSPFVFPGPRGGHCGYQAASHALQRAVTKAAVPRGTLHDFRHTFARHLVVSAPLNVVQAALGHSSIAMTQRYVKLQGDRTADYLEDFRIGDQTTRPSE